MRKDKETKDFFKERSPPYKNKNDNLNQKREGDCRESVFGDLAMVLQSIGNTFKTHNNQFYVALSRDEIDFLTTSISDIFAFFRLKILAISIPKVCSCNKIVYNRNQDLLNKVFSDLKNDRK